MTLEVEAVGTGWSSAVEVDGPVVGDTWARERLAGLEAGVEVGVGTLIS